MIAVEMRPQLPFDRLVVIWLQNDCPSQKNALALGPGRREEAGSVGRFIEPLGLPYEVQRESVRAW
jgi:hypothetical protein